MRLLARVPVLVIAFVALSCTATVPPAPTAPPVETRYGAPSVPNPRDVRPFAAAPCEGPWSAQTLPGLGFRAPGEERPVVGLPTCYWRDRTTKQEFSLMAYPNRDILADTYRVRLFAIFQPTTVGGLPAVREQSEPESISCTITVGTATTQGLVSTYTQLEVSANERADDPCGRGQRIAERIVETLPPLPGK